MAGHLHHLIVLDGREYRMLMKDAILLKNLSYKRRVLVRLHWSFKLAHFFIEHIEVFGLHIDGPGEYYYTDEYVEGNHAFVIVAEVSSWVRVYLYQRDV